MITTRLKVFRFEFNGSIKFARFNPLDKIITLKNDSQYILILQPPTIDLYWIFQIIRTTNSLYYLIIQAFSDFKRGIILRIETNDKIELIDITYEVESEVQNSGVEEGICIISIPHVSAGLMICENEQGFRVDIVNILNNLVPDGDYQHNLIDTNAEAQLKAVLLGSNEVIPIVDGKLSLGRWQSIFFAEMDGPRERNVNIIVIKKHDYSAE